MIAYAFLLGALLFTAWTVLAVGVGAVIGKGIKAADEHEQPATLPIEGRETRWDVLA